MKFVTYAQNKEQLDEIYAQAQAKNIPASDVEIIVSASAFSRYSESSVEDLENLVALHQKYPREERRPLVLEWDVLQQETLFKKTAELFSRLPLHEFKAVRVQDPGALNFVVENYPWLKVQLILENGNHNLAGLLRWKSFLGEALDRLVLSNELSKEHLAHYAQVMKGQLEVLAFGRILLFYSPRSLLSPLTSKEEKKSEFLTAFGTSEESPHAGFPLIENRHGTFMFNVKDLSLLAHLEELRGFAVGAARFDLRFDESFKHLSTMLDGYSGEALGRALTLKHEHQRPLIKGFYNVNKTDVLFPKLKNKRIQRRDENYVGEILDVERDEQMALLISSKHLQIKAGDLLQIVTPEGKTKVLEVKNLLGSDFSPRQRVERNDIILLPYVNGVVAKSQVYLKDLS